MRRTYLAILGCAALLAALPAAAAGPAKGKGKVDIGRAEYMEKCAVCHGSDARGTGGMADFMKKAPADLTVLAKKNAGVFPAGQVYEVIDGRAVVKGHGDRDMPVWGNAYNAEGTRAAEYYGDMNYDMEMFVRARVVALMDYLHRIQAK
ncbi:MAG: hypothetical protein HY854_05580 [Burkholderiales bacterium]|nr:hypothetical protein [Burkholderiales bacterium]